MRALLQEQREEALARFEAFCERRLGRELDVSLLLVEGSVDARVQAALSASGVAVVSSLGMQSLYRLSKLCNRFVLANVFAIEAAKYVGEMEALVVRRPGSHD